MANIVELQENGVAQYLKTHAKAVDGLKEAIVEIVYPVGSFYMSEVSTDPSEILGIGVWQRVKGKFLLGVDEGDSDISKYGLTGGEKTHTLTVEEIPSHTHAISRYNPSGTGFDATQTKLAAAPNNGSGVPGGVNTNPAGGGQAHNNMPPYYTAFIWRRTA